MAAGLDEAKDGGPALAEMVGRLLAARPELQSHFYWRSTTALCGNLKPINPAVAVLNNYLEAFLCAVPGCARPVRCNGAARRPPAEMRSGVLECS